MVVQWFPGHMFRAKKNIISRLPACDVVIQIIDARIPGSSLNPLLKELSRNHAQLYLLNKADLADPAVTALWLDYLRQQNNTAALAISANQSAKNSFILSLCRQLCPGRQGMDKPLRILIGGVPNVGKSSLINNLSGRKIATTGNIAGVTKSEQRIILAADVWLYDTPGLLWEKITAPQSGYRLAATGAVGRNAYEDEEVAMEVLAYILFRYPQNLRGRYNITDSILTPPQCLDLIAQSRGTVKKGGVSDYQKTAALVIQDFRTGRLGAISLEQPSEWELWVKTAAAEAAAVKPPADINRNLTS